MKKIILLLLVLAPFFSGFAQTVQDNFEKDYEVLIQNLTAEEWLPANTLSAKMLADIKGETAMEKEKSVLRYIVIYTAAGMLNHKEMTREKAETMAKTFLNQQLSMPAHLVKDNCYVNCTSLADDKENTLFSGVNNAAGTEIFSFEYVKMKEPMDEKILKPYDGKMVALSGKLTVAAVEGNLFPRFHLEFTDGEMEVYEE